MSRPFHDWAELRALLDVLCEESITPEQARRLEELLRSSPEAEAHYVQYMSFFADLSRRLAVAPGATEESLEQRFADRRPWAVGEAPRGETGVPSRPRVVGRRRSLAWGTAGLAALAAGLLLALALWPRPPRGPSAADEPTDNTVAVLLRASGAEWQDADLPPRPGAPLAPGWLRLKAGVVHLEFYSGAAVILEGPADFQLKSRTEAYCARGKLRATVPPQAQGFTIGSPAADLVDRGTEFGLQVDGDRRTEVHVFEGHVELYDAGTGRAAASRRDLRTGRGLRLDGLGAARPVEPDPAAFRTAEDVLAGSEEATRQCHERWLAASAVLRRDPSLLVYYPFQAEQPRGRTLTDRAGDRRAPRDGAIVGCAWATGRWPGKQGLEFRQVSDRVRVHVPGEVDALTLAAWVRVDALPNVNNSLFMTDAWEVGGVHWQVGEQGKLVLGVRAPPGVANGHYHAPDVFTPERLGRWTHLAVVYDPDEGLVTHFVDGRPASRSAVAFDTRLRLGSAEVGNWNNVSGWARQPIRFLSGCMDEFALFARALGDDEVERLYDDGRPPR